MIQLRRPNRSYRSSGFNTRYIALILAATMALVLWGYQKIYSENPSQLLLFVAIGLGVTAFAFAIYHILKIWINHRKGLCDFDHDNSSKN